MKLFLMVFQIILIFFFHWVFNVQFEWNTSVIILIIILSQVNDIVVNLNNLFNNISVYEDKEINDKL